MSKPSVEQFERKHTKMCKDGRQLSANLVLREFRDIYSHDIESDIYVYMAHERMCERQFWLGVSESYEPVRF
jgi:hypothetical protein